MTNRHKWPDIKARTTPAVRAKIEAEACLLSEDIRARTATGAAPPEAQEDVPNSREKD
jgi:hypothetical protein